jgi:hypothetical protein
VNALGIDLRGLTAAADPLFQPLRQFHVIQLHSSAQRALPDNQHPPALSVKLRNIAFITLDVPANLLQPEVGACRRDFKQIAVMMMPETAVGKDDALVRVDDEIRTPGKRGTLNSNPTAVRRPAIRFSIAVSRVPMARMFLLRVALL